MRIAAVSVLAFGLLGSSAYAETRFATHCEAIAQTGLSLLRSSRSVNFSELVHCPASESNPERDSAKCFKHDLLQLALSELGEPVDLVSVERPEVGFAYAIASANGDYWREVANSGISLALSYSARFALAGDGFVRFHFVSLEETCLLRGVEFAFPMKNDRALGILQGIPGLLGELQSDDR